MYELNFIYYSPLHICVHIFDQMCVDSYVEVTTLYQHHHHQCVYIQKEKPNLYIENICDISVHIYIYRTKYFICKYVNNGIN